MIHSHIQDGHWLFSPNAQSSRTLVQPDIVNVWSFVLSPASRCVVGGGAMGAIPTSSESCTQLFQGNKALNVNAKEILQCKSTKLLTLLQVFVGPE